MARRGHKCRCCDPPAACSGCPEDSSITLVASVEYPAGSGVVLPAGQSKLFFPPLTWTDVSTKCQAKADAVSIARVIVTNPGKEYTSVPSFSFTGGGGTVSAASMDVAFETKSITLTSGGSGYAESPTVTPGIVDAQVRGKIVSLSLIDAGAGYEETPTITFSGGTGATAVATLDKLGRVASLQLTSGGSDYPPSPTVRFEGGNPVIPAQATSKISGSVVSLTVLKNHTAVLQRQIGLSPPPPVSLSPSVSFFGACDTPATGKVEWDGRVVGITVSSSSGYTSPPAIKIEGGGGSGATAYAELSWEQKHERTSPVSSCWGQVAGAQYYNTFADQYPNYNQAFERISEFAAWFVTVSTDTQLRRMLNATQGVFPSVPGASLLNAAWFFPGEAIWVHSSRAWSVFSPNVVEGPAECGSGGVLLQRNALQTDENLFVRRQYSRIAPSHFWQVSLPQQSSAAINATLYGTYTHYVDLKSDSVWYLEELTLSNGGQNLYLLGPSSVVKFRPLNSSHEISVTAQASFAEPQAGQATIRGFLEQPQMRVSWQLIPGGNGSMYQAASVFVLNGGWTKLENQAVAFSVPLVAGYAESMPRFVGQIVSGRLDSAVVADVGRVRGPATITSISELPPDPLLRSPERFLCGESSRVVTRAHSSPTVIGHADMTSEGMDAGEFSVALQLANDLNGEAFWKVASLQVVRQPSGTLASTDIIFEPVHDTIAAVPAIARIVAQSRDAPNGSLLQAFDNGIVFENFTLQQQTDQYGDAFWRVTVAQLSTAASQRTGFVVNQEFPVIPIGLSMSYCELAKVTVTSVDNDGRITGFQVTHGGRYWKDRPGINITRFWVIDGGKYFRRTITETDTQLSTYSSCLGPVSAEAGWHRTRIQRIDPSVFQVNVGSQYGNDPAPRFRRCGMPIISGIELV